ncbi:uncharacterized protein LOC122441660 [Cervus canadensis]|uniref:uncharacterized protein LOC122441660 n=1 Tax=Cervus canadensis TaxID=1574408 RepID=UPI001C9E27B9|nr:uncharacterized protein LOC122441660 [Cervus canadensis]
MGTAAGKRGTKRGAGPAREMPASRGAHCAPTPASPSSNFPATSLEKEDSLKRHPTPGWETWVDFEQIQKARKGGIPGPGTWSFGRLARLEILGKLLKLNLEHLLPSPRPATEQNVNNAPWSCAASKPIPRTHP